MNISALVRFLLYNVVAVPLETVCKGCCNHTSSDSTSFCSAIRSQGCVCPLFRGETELSIFPRVLGRRTAEAVGGAASRDTLSTRSNIACRHTQWKRNDRFLIMHPYLTVSFYVMREETNRGDLTSCWLTKHASPGATTTHKKPVQRNRCLHPHLALPNDRRRRAGDKPVPGSTSVRTEHGSGYQPSPQVSKQWELSDTFDTRLERRFSGIQKLGRNSCLSALFTTGFSWSTVKISRLIAAATASGGLPQLVENYVQHNQLSFLLSASTKSKGLTLESSAQMIFEKFPFTASVNRRKIRTGGRQLSLVRARTSLFLVSHEVAMELSPTPPTRTSHISLDPSLIRLLSKTETRYALSGDDDKSEENEEPKLLQRRGVRSQWTMAANDLREGQLRGPLSVQERHHDLASVIDLEGPRDVYILDFDTVIQLNLREMVSTAIRAWRHLEKGDKISQRFSGSSDHCSATALLRHNIRMGKGTQKTETFPNRGSKKETCVIPSGDASTGSRFGTIFLKQRFDKMDCPTWLEARMRDCRRSLAMRGCPDFMIALRRIVELVMRVEKRRGSTIDAFVNSQENSFRDKWEKMTPAQKMWLLTKNGNFMDIQDSLKFKRGSANATGTQDDSGYPWIVQFLRGWESNGERMALYRSCKTTEAELQQAFNNARAAWKEADKKSWAEHVKYRSSLTHIDSMDADRREIYEGFNTAAVWCLTNHINNWRCPVHILSVWETTADVLSLLHVMGLSPADTLAASLVHIYGRDTMEQLHEAKAKDSNRQHQIAAPIERIAQEEAWTLTPSALREEEETACLKRTVVSYILRGWRAAKDAWKPVHVIDGNVRSLLALRDFRQLGALRLYFCEWGPSTMEDKATALLASGIKYIKRSMELVKVMSTPANIPARCWTHGYTSCSAPWMEEYKSRHWLRWCGFMGEEKTVLQDTSALEQAAR